MSRSFGTGKRLIGYPGPDRWKNSAVGNWINIYAKPRVTPTDDSYIACTWGFSHNRWRLRAFADGSVVASITWAGFVVTLTSAAGALTVGSWNTVGLLWVDGSKAQLWVNGVKADETIINLDGIPGGDASFISIGLSDNGEGVAFDGDIAEFSAGFGNVLSESDFILIQTGADPSDYSPTDYLPIYGDDSPEPESVGGYDFALEGSPAQAPHPSIGAEPVVEGLTGTDFSAAQGAVSGRLRKALSGVDPSAASGTLSTKLRKSLSGLDISAAQGSLSDFIRLALSGADFGAAQGSVSEGIRMSLMGGDFAAAAGSIALATLRRLLAGVDFAAALGTLSVPSTALAFARMFRVPGEPRLFKAPYRRRLLRIPRSKS